MEKERLLAYQQQIIMTHYKSFTKEKVLCYAMLKEAQDTQDVWAQTYASCCLLSSCITMEQHEEVSYYMDHVRIQSEQHAFYDLQAAGFLLCGRYYHRSYDDGMALEYYCKGLTIMKQYQLDAIEPYLLQEIAALFFTHEAWQDASVYALHGYELSLRYDLQNILLQEEQLMLLAMMELKQGHVDAAQPYLTALHKLPSHSRTLYAFLQVMKAFQLQQVEAVMNGMQDIFAHRHSECLEHYLLFAIYDELVTIALTMKQQKLAKQCLMMLSECSSSRYAHQLLVIQRSFIRLCESFPCPYDINMLYQDYFHLSEKAVKQASEVQVCSYRDKIRFHDIQQQNQMLKQKAGVDEVTQLKNRSCFHMEIEAILQQEELNTIGIAMCDIDNFKEFNDVYGHLYGDKIIRKMGDILRMYADESIIPYRFGGDEFLCLFLNTDEATIRHYLHCIFQQLRAEHDQLRISAGYSFTHKEKLFSLDQIIEEADLALYQAKDCGKNQFIAYQK